MDLEIVILSEINQRKTNQMILHICAILKKNGKINSSTKQKQFVVGNKPIHIQYSASQIEKGKYIILFISGI